MRSILDRDFGQLVQSYLVNVVLYSLALFFYRNGLYYRNFLLPNTQTTLLLFVGIYLILAIPLELALPPERRRLHGKGIIALRAVLRFIRDGWRYLSRFPLERDNPPAISKKEKTAILFLLVKFYYLPIMLNFMFGNWNGVMQSVSRYDPAASIHAIMLGVVFPGLIALFFFIDTLYFVFGYSTEYPGVRNEVRSVEPTLFGWGIALICYPPFNGLMDQYLVFAANNNASLDSLISTYVMQTVALILLALYLWATLALGPRSSNLTNRGIVDWGPYAYVRHPAYVGKTLGWWVTSIPFLLQPGKFLLGAVSMTVWMTVYFFRALTEERHLIADPDYQAYCRKVRWRFIPYVL
jgi:protein-S-isoprenylcysteine O-methyltransferase Ste14